MLSTWATIRCFVERRKVDLTPLLSYPAYEELRDKKQFVQFGLDQTIFWKNGADIAPEWLYEKGTDDITNRAER